MSDTIQRTLELMAKGQRTDDIREKLKDSFLTYIKSSNNTDAFFPHGEFCVGAYIHFIDGKVCLDLHMDTQKGNNSDFKRPNVVKINLEDREYTINPIVSKKITNSIRGVMGECGYKEK